MTKQEKIRKGIQGWVNKRFGVPNTFNTQLLYDFLVYLDENGAVIKVEGELPKYEYLHNAQSYQVKIDTLKAGYGAFEPLIKEGE